jgi:low affinity Fe/Cu permease
MVFLIQRTQNKDSIAIHLKLNELVVAHEHASNRLVAVENISEEELKVLQKFYKHLAQISLDELSVEESHSLNVANANHIRKYASKKSQKDNIKADKFYFENKI